ncbi:hypothetical protein AZE42_12034 [Rhizopogon vesiculosus]|uniref:Uncharacterized protein n=1 Tax=Rhizopogon vesiculosus TaxID=180088 RepID=A0A1J8QXK6_9AGAM|nr:hypothetical protein AZE42_12034 [Rhizopogon vesiculosus]
MAIVFLFPMTPQTNVASMDYTVVVLGGILLSVVWYYFPVNDGVVHRPSEEAASSTSSGSTLPSGF